MGKRRVRVIFVRKAITIALLLVTSALMVGLVYALAGRAYVYETHSLRDVVAEVATATGGPWNRVAAQVMPFVANALVFVPWGFLAFVAIDTPMRSRLATYALTLAAGALFASAVAIWQIVLPTRVTAASDLIANVGGTLAGAVCGHLRKQVHVHFEF